VISKKTLAGTHGNFGDAPIPDARLGPEIAPPKIRRMWLSAALKGVQGSSQFERRSDQRMIEQQHDPLKVCR